MYQGYNRAAPPAAIPSFSGPVRLDGAINAPLDPNGYTTSTGFGYFPFNQAQGYNPDTCALGCLALNAKQPDSSCISPKCSFFDAYTISKNGVPQGLYCAYYNQTWTNAQATNYGQTNGNDKYTFSQSYGYSLESLPGCNLVQDSNFTQAATKTFPHFDPWYADVIVAGGVFADKCDVGPACMGFVFVPGFSGADLTQGGITTVGGASYTLSFYQSIITTQNTQCSMAISYLNNGWLINVSGGKIPEWVHSSYIFTTNTSATGNLTFTIICEGNDYSSAELSQVSITLVS
jgi:hypothetical protein